MVSLQGERGCDLSTWVLARGILGPQERRRAGRGLCEILPSLLALQNLEPAEKKTRERTVSLKQRRGSCRCHGFSLTAEKHSTRDFLIKLPNSFQKQAGNNADEKVDSSSHTHACMHTAPRYTQYRSKRHLLSKGVYYKSPGGA